MTTDTRTAAEIAYDKLKDGSAYVKEADHILDEDPAPNLPQVIKDWIDRRLAEEEAPKSWPDQRAEMYARIDAIVVDPSLSPEDKGRRCAAIIAEYDPQDVARIPATLTTLPPIEAQIAAIPPMSRNGAVDILAVTLPDEIELTRCTFNGAPAEWWRFSVMRSGSIYGVMAQSQASRSVSTTLMMCQRRIGKHSGCFSP